MKLASCGKKKNQLSLFSELERRNVFRFAIVYIVAIWLVLQVSQPVLQAIEAPPWVLKVFLLLFALDLPIILLFSWAYELTPEGLKERTGYRPFRINNARHGQEARPDNDCVFLLASRSGTRIRETNRRTRRIHSASSRRRGQVFSVDIEFDKSRGTDKHG